MDREGVEKLIGFLPLFLGDDPHGENGDNDEENEREVAQHVFKVGRAGVEADHHGVNPPEEEEKGAEHIAGEPGEIGGQFMAKDGFI